VSALELLVVLAVLVGMSVQSAVGFGFAFFVAPAAFAAFAPEEAVMLVLLLAIPINCLVLFAERRSAQVAVRQTATVVAAALPGMFVGAWALTEIDGEALQALVGAVVLVAALGQALGAEAGGPPRAPGDAALTEIGGGLAAGALTTSVSVNGPALLLIFSRLGLRGDRLRDSLAGALLGLCLPATVIVAAVAGRDGALPDALVLAACAPAVLIGHRFGASVFRRLDDATHHRAALGAAALAGLLSIGAAVL
jgi:uncharacterized protein